MSFTLVTPARTRLNRSQLAVPGSNPRFIEKALGLKADIIMFDLEDAVAPADKAKARTNVVAAIKDLDWADRTLSVRINGLDTPYMYRDVIEVVEGAGKRLDLMMIPKVGVPADVYAVDMLITQIETAMGYPKRLGLELLIESALGLQNVDALARASDRLESLHFGPGDFAASTGMRTMTIGGPHPDYTVLTDADDSGQRQAHWNDMWHAVHARLVVAARATGLRPVDGPFANFKDEAGFRAAAARAAVMGCDGKWVIHPSQIDLANDYFTPAAEEVEKARRILDAMEEAQKSGSGAVVLEGRMIDIASIRQAQTLVNKAEAIAARP